MRRLSVEPPARADIKAIRNYTRRVFGAGAQLKYGALMQRAFDLLRENPNRTGVRVPDDLPRAPYTFHLRHARTRGVAPKQPRHIVVFTSDDATLTVLRVLHDSMDLARHVDDDESKA